MKFDPEKYHRRSIRLPGYDYSRTGAYFVTFCTKQRESLLGRVIDAQMIMNAAGQALCQIWESLPERFPQVSLDAFVVMPNHVHGILIIDSSNELTGDAAECRGAACCAPFSSPAPTLGQIMRAFKSIAAIGVNRLLGRTGQTVWQRNYYEHIIRDDASLNRIREYIATNPRRWDCDRENPDAAGMDDFDKWLDRFYTKPPDIKL